MVIDALQRFAPARVRTHLTERRSEPSFLAAVLERTRQWLCGLRGHTTVLHLDDRRIAVLCTSCQYVSPGLVLADRPPRLTHVGDPNRYFVHRVDRRRHPVWTIEDVRKKTA